MRLRLIPLITWVFALAIGIALGGGPLSRITAAVEAPDTAPASEPSPDPAAELNRLSGAAGDAFARSAADRLYADELSGRGVVLVTLPGADRSLVDALTTQIRAAGGTVSTTVSARAALLDPAEKSYVDTLGRQLADSYGRGVARERAGAYERIGALLGAALGTTAGRGAAISRDSEGLLASLTGAKLIAKGAAPSHLAPLVVVLLGNDSDSETADAVFGQFLTGLSGQVRGVLVAADLSSGANGQLARLRSGTALATVTSVDGVDRSAGQVTAVLALIRSLHGPAGHFGASGADGAVPLD